MAKKKNEIKIADINISEIVKVPDNYPEEIVAVALMTFQNMKRELSDHISLLQNNIIDRMEKDGAVKLMFKNGEEEHIATLRAGKTECKEKNADELYKKHGFEPLEIGSYEFKPSWVRAKEARKFGGEKQRIIDLLFVEGRKFLNIE